ncbi:alpha/beta fold hydrolase [Fusibacter ferrireducens]|uniref:Alpha/beta hydrolase n=1 Tax=Fusibacter ferrireducens TaxID=2785058 RepID=A0ABR9ZRK9_9FIRM|nr:alpha/beta hydrolase [Fusibacter ferrireducens]MBF4693080.1 alpha/beta hydrolase [Fusibacter ferrireducens]
MKRKYFESNGLKLSYLDNEEIGKPMILCLHGLFGNARYYSNFLELKKYHVLSLDQRGHGFSQHAATGQYTCEHLLSDFLSFLDKVSKENPVMVIGHSLGGIIAYYAAAERSNISKLVVEDIGAIVKGDASFASQITHRTSSLLMLSDSLKKFGIKEPSYFMESAFNDEAGWGFRFDKEHMAEIHESINGDHWDVLLSSSCPMLLVHGQNSWVVSDEHVIEIGEKRENTKVVMFEHISHGINMEVPNEFLEHVNCFLNE